MFILFFLTIFSLDFFNNSSRDTTCVAPAIVHKSVYKQVPACIDIDAIVHPRQNCCSDSELLELGSVDTETDNDDCN